MFILYLLFYFDRSVSIFYFLFFSALLIERNDYESAKSCNVIRTN